MNSSWIKFKIDIVDIDRSGLRKFGIVTGSLVGLLFGILLPWIWLGTPNFPQEVLSLKMPAVPWSICFILITWSLVAPSTLRLPYRIWMRFALVLGHVNSRIILALVFVLLFIPIGVLLRFFKGNPMARTGPAGEFRISLMSRDPNHMERPF